MPSSSGAVDLGSLSQADQEAVARLAEERGGDLPEEPTKQEALTAFIVIVPKGGSPEVLRLNDPDLSLVSEPTNDLIYAAAATIVKDIQVAEAAQASAVAVVETMMAQTRAMVDHQQTADIKSRLGL